MPGTVFWTSITAIAVAGVICRSATAGWEQNADEEITKLVRAWPDEGYVIGQRLELRLCADSPVAAAYDSVR